MEKKINPVLKRLSDFADSKGGFAEVGRRIQKHPSMFYNLIRRDALPSLATLSEIAMAFPDLDLNFVIRGVEKEETVSASELDKVKSELYRERAISTALLGKSAGAINSPGKTTSVRRKQFKDTMRSMKNREVCVIPDRVQESLLSKLMS